MRNIVKALVEISLFLLRFLFFVKKIIITVFSKILIKPIRFILRFIYYSIVYPVYKFYLSLSKKANLRRGGNKKIVSTLLINKRVIHVLMIVITITLAYSNLTNAQEATSSEDLVRKTILSKLVSDELVEYDILIEEYQTEGANFTLSQESYLAQNTLKPNVRINTKEELDYLDDFDIETIQVGEIEDYISTTKSISKREGKIEYSVKSGDTISTIAQKFGISVNTILWANNLTAHSYIRPGDKLIILPISGVAHKIASGESLLYLAKYYDIDQEDIMTTNNITNPNQLSVGQEILIPGGNKIGSTSRTTASTSRPATSTTTSPGASAKPVYGTKMNWPTEGHRITQYYSWRHNGLDIANKTGTPIYATDAGVVEIAAWNRYGYGNQILINHGGGKKTRYAHLSKFSVKKGDSVDKGQYIGAMGSTGRSTGPHIHFEVIFNGKRYNPLNYIEY